MTDPYAAAQQPRAAALVALCDVAGVLDRDALVRVLATALAQAEARGSAPAGRLVPDATWASLTIWQESRGETHAGRVAVGEVIRTRMAQCFFSDGSVAGTVLRASQFSGWNTKDPNRIACASLDAADPMLVDCLRAWEESAGTNLTNGAVLYFAPAAVPEPPAWALVAKLAAIVGRHHFYRA